MAHDEPHLLITPNQAAMKLLARLIEEPERDDEEPCWEATIPLRITKADLERCMFGNGDLATIGFWIADDGSAEAVAFPDPETPMAFPEADNDPSRPVDNA
jgi:hypothetical protein